MISPSLAPRMKPAQIVPVACLPMAMYLATHRRLRCLGAGTFGEDHSFDTRVNSFTRDWSTVCRRQCGAAATSPISRNVIEVLTACRCRERARDYFDRHAGEASVECAANIPQCLDWGAMMVCRSLRLPRTIPVLCRSYRRLPVLRPTPEGVRLARNFCKIRFRFACPGGK